METLFCDAKPDCDSYRANFNAICTALAETISGKKAQPGPTPPEPPVTAPPPPSGHQMVKQGSSGPEVVTLQKALGCLVADGNFGPTTDTWVRAFQAACDLEDDGIVGDDTWAEVDDLIERVETEKPRLPKALANRIYTMAQTSEIADYAWPDRGIAPDRIYRRRRLSFAYAIRRGDDDDAVNVMSQAQGNPDKDALAWYEAEFTETGHGQPYRRTRYAASPVRNDDGSGYAREFGTVLRRPRPEREQHGIRYLRGWTVSDELEHPLRQSNVIEPLIFDFWNNPNGFLSAVQGRHHRYRQQPDLLWYRRWRALSVSVQVCPIVYRHGDRRGHANPAPALGADQPPRGDTAEGGR